jgi:hypothetical protein
VRAVLGAAALIILLSACTSNAGTDTAETVTESTVGETTSTQAPSTTATEPPTTTTTAPPEPLAKGSFGIAVYQGRADTVAEIEASVGRELDIVRWFARWDTPIPNAELTELSRTGHAIHLSVRPRTESGATVPWIDLARATPGTYLYEAMERLVDNAAAIGPNVYLTLNHEAETADSSRNGSAEEFIGAWRVFYGILRDRTGPLTDPSDPDQIAAVYTVGNSAFSDGRAGEFYPGDEFVDVVGIDVYNWHTCQGTERPWVQLEQLVQPGLAFARARNKPVAIPEFGSVEDPNDRFAKAEWMRNAGTTLGSLRRSDGLLFAAWFDVTGAGGAWIDCVWDHDSSAETLEGFTDLVGATSKRR